MCVFSGTRLMRFHPTQNNAFYITISIVKDVVLKSKRNVLWQHVTDEMYFEYDNKEKVSITLNQKGYLLFEIF